MLSQYTSQGMTLTNVIVNRQFCFQPGQLGVAVGGTVSVAGLNIVNFIKKEILKKSKQCKPVLYRLHT